MTEAYTRMTQSKTRELLRDLWADTPEGKAQPLQTAYARAMDFAFRQVATGTLDLNTAIRRAVTPLAKRGLRTIEQKRGRSVGIEYACRRYIMDQLGQLDDEIQRADHDALGCDGWEISAHAACAPDHEPIQGRQYGDAEFEKLNNSLQRRIGHLNCGHTANPIILGVNAPQYTEAQLQKFKDDNERGVVYNGYRYTLYEAGQEQSRIENGIRLIPRQILDTWPGRSRAAAKTASGSSSARFWPTKKPKAPICRSIKSSCGSCRPSMRDSARPWVCPLAANACRWPGLAAAGPTGPCGPTKRLRRSNFGT